MSTATSSPYPRTLLALASAGIGASLLTPAILTLPLIVDSVAPASATATLSAIIAVGTVAGLIAAPLGGALSDRVPSRVGRRRPWLFLAAGCIAAGGVLLAVAADPLGVGAGWVLTSVGAAVALTTMTASIAERVPVQERGLPSALVGLGQPIGVFAGLVMAQFLSVSLAAMAVVPALAAAATTCVFGIVVPDPPHTPEKRTSSRTFPLAGWARTAWNLARHADFAWAWMSRLLMSTPIAATAAYLVFFLISSLHVDGPAIPQAMLMTWAVVACATLATALACARLSDRWLRRKPFVFAGAAMMTAGLVSLVFADDFAWYVVAMALLGLGQGTYLAVDVALISQVLPDKESAGGGMGIANLAPNLPGVLVPLVAPALLTIGDTEGSFWALFIFAAGTALVGAVSVVPVRSVR